MEFVEVIINYFDLFVCFEDKKFALHSLSKIILNSLKTNIPFPIAVIFCLSLSCYLRL